MAIKDLVKETTVQLNSLCESYEKKPLLALDSLKETVCHLSQEVQAVDIASDQLLKKDLNTLQSALQKLSSVITAQQEVLSHQMEEFHLHQLALQAYARVANHNLDSLA